MPNNSYRELSDTQLKILNEAFILFGRHGYEGMSMKVLAQNTGITKAALYWHYESKDDLYLECVRKITNIFIDHTHVPLGRSDLPPAMRLMCLVAGVRALLAHPAMKDGVVGYWLVPSTGHIERVWTEVRGFRKQSFELLEQTLAEGEQQGAFEFDIPKETVARSVHYTIESNIIPLAFFTNTLATRQHAAVLLHAFIKAFSPDHSGLGSNLDQLNNMLDQIWSEHTRICPRETYARPDSGASDEVAETLM